jgi:single-stranded DNA-binding protein
VKGADGQYVKEFTSHSGIVWGKEAEWLIRDGKKGSLVGCAGTFRVRKWEKDGKAGAGTDIQCQTAKILDREEVGDTETTQAPAPRRPAPVAAGGPVPEDAPFAICQFQGA